MRLILAGLWLILGAMNVAASPFSVGVQRETWGDVDLEASTNPNYPASKELGYGHLKFTMADMTTWYLEEPGVIFGMMGAIAETEANEVAARQKAQREGSLIYSWEYARPAPIPEGRWNRWSYTAAKTTGATVFSSALVSAFNSQVTLDYQQLSMDIVTGPLPWGNFGVYWMPSSEIRLRSLKMYQAPAVSSTDFSTIAVPFNYHVGFQSPLPLADR